jgi:hypothetical protein
MMNKFALSLCIFFLQPVGAMSQELITFENGSVADADEINHNFEVLQQGVNEIVSPAASYNYIEQVVVDGDPNLIKTKLRFYEVSSYSTFRSGSFATEDFRSWGTETVVNALGSFSASYQFVFPPVSGEQLVNTEAPPFECPDGTQPLWSYNADYGYALRTLGGVILLGSNGLSDEKAGTRSSIYNCAAGSYEDEAYDELSYVVLEGRGIGSFACIQSAMAHGAIGGALGRGWDKLLIRGREFELGVFKPESNGLPGSYVLEIIAPSGCIPAK